MINISIIITTHKRDLLFSKTLESLSNCTVPDCPTRLIVIENGYKGDAKSICNSTNMKVPVHYYYLERPGTSNARKYSVDLVGDDEFLILFDDDIIFQKDILVVYFQAFKKYGRGYFYGGAVYPNYEKHPKFKYMELFPYSVKGFTPFEETTTIDQPFFLGANMAAHTADILLAGNFNPDLGPGGRLGSGGHEHDLQERLLKKGISGLYLSDAIVWHFVPQNVLNFNWLKKRVYKQGLSAGFHLSTESYNAYWGNVPRWFLREFLGNCLRLLLYTLRPKRDLNYFKKKLEFHKALGVMAYFLKVKKS